MLMTEPPEARSIIENAELAASAGDYPAAEGFLRAAAALQEETLGPSHPGLANTFNNLGIVCEITDNPIDAEQFFRRAHAIATTTLAPDHPFVATSRKNLHDFCAARGRPVELPPTSLTVAAWPDVPAAGSPASHEPSRSATSRSATTRDLKSNPQRRSFLPVALAALCGVGLLIAILTMARPRGSAVEETMSPPATSNAPARETPVPAPTAPAVEPLEQPQHNAKVTQSTPSEDHVTGADSGSPAGPEVPAVATAQLCTALRDWHCEAADSQVVPGPMFFYTQLKSAAATTIEHRWYQGDRLHRRVQLHVEANPRSGYRTFSRNTISSESTGDWRVELRSADGTVLYEESFTVR